MEITKSKFYKPQYSSYDARTEEAKKELKEMGLEINGFGKEIETKALLGFFQDDSGYKNKNIDLAKLHSGFVPNLEKITMLETEEEKAERLEDEKSEKERIENEEKEKIERVKKQYVQYVEKIKTAEGSKKEYYQFKIDDLEKFAENNNIKL